MTEMIRPIHDRVIVQRDEAQDKTTSGIYLPGNSKDVPKKGTVIAVGEGRRMQDGTLLSPSVNVGDRVIFGRYAGAEVEVNGDKLSIMRETDIAAIIEDVDADVNAGTSTPRREGAHSHYQG